MVTQAHRHRDFINSKDRVREPLTERERVRETEEKKFMIVCEKLMHKTSVFMTI